MNNKTTNRLDRFRENYPDVDINKLSDEVWNRIDEELARPAINWCEIDRILKRKWPCSHK